MFLKFLNQLCFNNGYYGFEKQELINKCDDVTTKIKMDMDFPELNENVMFSIYDIYNYGQKSNTRTRTRTRRVSGRTEEENEEIEEEKPIVKPKRVLTEKQLESLKRAREAPALKTRIKRTSAKS